MTEKWLIASDFQIPYEDKKATELWFKVLKSIKPEHVDYPGDISDQLCFSKYAMNTHEEFLNALGKPEHPVEEFLPFIKEQEKPVADFYKKTRKMLPNAEIVAELGNHDIRVWDYASRKLPELLKEITPESLWGLDNLGIDYILYKDLPLKRYGDLFLHHGVAVSKHAGQSVQADVDSFGVSILRGHSHRAGTYFKTNELRNETVRGYEIGHMCDEKSPGMEYSQVHNWQKGFAAGLIDGDNVHIELCEIKPDYSVMVLGKLYRL